MIDWTKIVGGLTIHLRDDCPLGIVYQMSQGCVATDLTTGEDVSLPAGYYVNPKSLVMLDSTLPEKLEALDVRREAEWNLPETTHMDCFNTYELRKTLQSPESDIDAWLYGESDNDRRALMPECNPTRLGIVKDIA